MGQTSVYTSTFHFDKNDECLVCSSEHDTMTIHPSKKLSELRDEITKKFKLSNPGLVSENKGNLYIGGALAKKLQPRLDLTMQELIDQGLLDAEDVIEVTDKLIPSVLRMTVHIKE